MCCCRVVPYETLASDDIGWVGTGVESFGRGVCLMGISDEIRQQQIRGLYEG